MKNNNNLNDSNSSSYNNSENIMVGYGENFEEESCASSVIVPFQPSQQNYDARSKKQSSKGAQKSQIYHRDGSQEEFKTNSEQQAAHVGITDVMN